jgi:hypothetical protein
MTIARTLNGLLVAAFAVVFAGCSSTAPHPEQWRLRINGPDGSFVGGVVLELGSEYTRESCVGGNNLVLARIVEKHGFRDDQVGESAGVWIDGRRLYADLSLGVCDHTLTVSGPIRGNRASGEARRSTLVGAFLVGRFVAERVQCRLGG